MHVVDLIKESLYSKILLSVGKSLSVSDNEININPYSIIAAASKGLFQDITLCPAETSS
jgi:hypothetical protein